MAYERQFFTKGQVLTAEEMNEMDYWLAHICGREITAAETNSRGELVFIFRDGGTLNIGSVGGGGLTLRAIDLLIDILRHANYTEDMSSQIELLAHELMGGGGNTDGGGFIITDDGNGNVTIEAYGSASITDDGNGNVTLIASDDASITDDGNGNIIFS